LRIALLVVAATLGIGLAVPSIAGAYVNLFRPFLGPAPADPCHATSIDGGTLVREQPAPPQPSVKRYVVLLCGPVFDVANPSVLLADDQIWQFYLGRRGAAPVHMFQGGIDQVPFDKGISMKKYPYLKGPDGHAPGFDTAITDPDSIQNLEEIIDKALSIISNLDTVECILGAIESGGASCLEALANQGLEVVVQDALIAAVLIDAAVKFVESRETMANSDWFYWSDNYGFWNLFGDAAPSWIDPSIAMTGLGAANVRMGVVFSNVALDQLGDFDLSKADVRRGHSKGIAQLAERARAASRGKTLIGGPEDERLGGGRFADIIDGRLGRDEIRGRAGDEQILQGGPGADRLYGGAGDDTLDGYRGRDRLIGGRGNDQLVDVFGRSRIRTGSGHNLVFIRDGAGDDRVTCRGSSQNLVHADRGDRISPTCRANRSRIVFGGRRLTDGHGY